MHLGLHKDYVLYMHIYFTHMKIFLTKCLVYFFRIAEVCFFLYHISSEVRKGNNKTCTSKQQAWGAPSLKTCKRYSATPLNDIPIKKAKMRSSVAILPGKSVTGGRSDYDSRTLADRQPMTFTKVDLQKVDVACNGKCTLLL